MLRRQGSPKINKEFDEKTGKRNEWYDPSRPEGVLVYKTADKLEYEEVKKLKDKKTGKYLRNEEGNFVYEKTGKIKTRTQKSTKMAETDDARTLISDLSHPTEEAYASYANYMKHLAQKARVAYLNTGKIDRNPSAALKYKAEVDKLNADLRIAEANRPRERRAQALATSRSDAKIRADEDLIKDEIKKLRNRELLAARKEVGAERHEIEISDRQWEAIQAGAISETQLMKILNHANIDKVRERATPRSNKGLSDGKIARIQALKSSGYTNQEIANALGCSTSTVAKYL